MFENKTLFILGAGASVPYGFPTGAGLIDLIKKEIENFRQPYDLYREKYEPLLKDLELFQPTSIDSFIKIYPDHAETAKEMIAYVLLGCERTSCLEKESDWYSHFFTDLLLGCENAAQLFENKIKIATFNYDQSLEYYFFSRIRKSKFKDQKRYFFNEGIITHVHGCFYQSPDELENNYGVFCKHNNNSFTTSSFNDQHSKKSRRAKSLSNYLLCTQDINNEIKINIKEYEDIYLIGFSFDRDNLNKIGFPGSFDGYSNMGEIKSIKWMDYDGKMNSLNNQFSRIENIYRGSGDNHKIIITRSTATSITDAYQNDFKVRLF